ncbi:hypothetical protein [Streptomyces sp. NBC_00878]|uniref:hypothetical protein n=1 Tax=Streptomyces sp. NBC_00878 TaxID=2975854 RepID=UPI00224F0D5D|nr:hypothetical protein [Streptomyces sp. NBC_00878]MCX4905412.1 hypothetical protein [Streptomyces sp. NBC_00878]
MGRAVPLGRARANGPHQLRTELARQIRDRAVAVLPSITVRLRRGSVRRLFRVWCSTVVMLVCVHAPASF